ncbi:MAG: hypothetical protein ACYS9X_29610 [Planctomycetota bacterium]|jgi:dipeptidyl aminopeptidase/acylaminoacyl peptidase
MGLKPPMAASLASLLLAACVPHSINKVAVSPDGRLAFAVGRGGDYTFLNGEDECDIISTDCRGREVKRVISNGRHNSWATFSPDGRSLLAYDCRIEKIRGFHGETVRTEVRDEALVLHDIATGESRTLCRDSDISGFPFPRFSPDGTRLAYLAERRLKVVNFADGAPVASWPRWSNMKGQEQAGVLGLAWTGPDELFLAWGSQAVGEDALNIGPAVAVRLGTVRAAEGDFDRAEWLGPTHSGVTWCFPWMTARRGKVVLPLFDVELPVAGGDAVARASLQPWLYAGGKFRRLTEAEGRHFYTELSPDGSQVAAIWSPSFRKGREEEAGDDGDRSFICGPGKLLVLDVASGGAETVREERCLHPFWVDNSRLGSVGGGNGEAHVSVLDLRSGEVLDLTEEIAPRLGGLLDDKARPE